MLLPLRWISRTVSALYSAENFRRFPLLRRWVEQAEVEAGRGPEGALKRSEREELVELRRENQRLRLEREILKKSDGLLRQGERVRFAFFATEKACYPVALMCRVLHVSRSG